MYQTISVISSTGFKHCQMALPKVQKKYYLTRSFGDLKEQIVLKTIGEIYELIFVKYDQKDRKFKKEFSNFKLKSCSNIKHYLFKLFEYLDKIFIDFAVKEKIDYAIRTLPKKIVKSLDLEVIDKKVFTNKLFFIRFIDSFCELTASFSSKYLNRFSFFILSPIKKNQYLFKKKLFFK